MNTIQRLQEKLPENIDCLLVTCEAHQRYLTGFPFTDGYVVVGREHAWLLTDFRYIEAAKKYESDSLTVLMFENRGELTEKLFKDNGFTRIGYEEDTLLCSDFDALTRRYPDLTFVRAGGILALIRRVKTQDEVDKIVKAQRIAEKTLDRVLSLMTPNMTEREVAIELDFGMRKLGAEGSAFETIAVSGSASSMPHGVPRDVKLERGFLTMDFGAIYDGYLSDMTRTVVIGKADDEMKKLYNTVLSAQLAAIDYVKAGALGSDCDKVARDIIYGNGYEGCFGHSLGHGVGIYIHEEPRLSMKWDSPLEVGAIVTVEPGIYIPGKYGCRIEDMVYLKDGETVDLTNAPKEMIELF